MEVDLNTQSGVAAPALVDSQATAKTLETQNGTGASVKSTTPVDNADVVEISPQAQVAAGQVNASSSPDMDHDGDRSSNESLRQEAAESMPVRNEKIKESISTISSNKRQTGYKVKDGQVTMQIKRNGQVKEIPSEEIRAIQEKIRDFSAQQKQSSSSPESAIEFFA
jgi:hypothetical protein